MNIYQNWRKPRKRAHDTISHFKQTNGRHQIKKLPTFNIWILNMVSPHSEHRCRVVSLDWPWTLNQVNNCVCMCSLMFRYILIFKRSTFRIKALIRCWQIILQFYFLCCTQEIRFLLEFTITLIKESLNCQNLHIMPRN